MQDDLAQRIASHPKYKELKAKRTSFGWWLTAAMMVVYYGFILLVAYDKEFLAQKVGTGMHMSLGIPLGVGVIVFTIILTWIYVNRANNEFDAENAEIIREATK